MTSKNRFSYNLAIGSSSNDDTTGINSITIFEQQKMPSAALAEIKNRKLQQQNLNSANDFDNNFKNSQPYYANTSKMRQISSSSVNSDPISFIDSNPNYDEPEKVDSFDDELDWLLPGETLIYRETSHYYNKQIKSERIISGHIYVTNYRLRFIERNNEGFAKGIDDQPKWFDVTLGSMSKIEKIGYYNGHRRPGTATKPPLYGIEIICKDCRNVRFIHHRESHGRRALFECLRTYAFPITNRMPLFANLYAENFEHNGWALFDIVAEFKRQKLPKTAWVPCDINENYEFAGTYPSLFYVPAQVYKRGTPYEFLHCVSEFRSKRRIPVLSWIHHKSLATIVRSAQPMVGALSRKSATDEEYIEMIIDANPNKKSNVLIILDARPSINAKANRANGGGYENYPRCKLEFMNIQNIHKVRESLKKLKDACYPVIQQKYFQQALEETKWKDHLNTILKAANMTVKQIKDEHNSVLVHCSDGWDRTAQITSLAMLQLDSYYRTIEGFAVLIEKEWCSFGHKFSDRIGQGEEKPDDKERSPIFVQFIDCVWQLFNKFESAFEYNVQFLMTILDELYSCRFGTFLYNNERERMELDVKHKTKSLWSYILDNRVHFLNHKYDPNVTLDDISAVHSLFWTGYYCRYSSLLPNDNQNSVRNSIASESYESNIPNISTVSDPFPYQYENQGTFFQPAQNSVINSHKNDLEYVNIKKSSHHSSPAILPISRERKTQQDIMVPSNRSDEHLRTFTVEQQRQRHFHDSTIEPVQGLQSSPSNRSSRGNKHQQTIITRI